MKRREFIKKAGLATAGAISVPFILPSGRLFAASGKQMVLCSALVCLAADQEYFIDAINGNDETNLGTSEDDAWQTTKNLQTYIFPANSVIKFKKGGNWYPAMELSDSAGWIGDQWIINPNIKKITSYGTATNKPRIWGTVKINDDWRFAWVDDRNKYLSLEGNSWSSYQGDIYMKKLGAVPYQVFDYTQRYKGRVTEATATTVTLNRGEYTYISGSYHPSLSKYNGYIFIRMFADRDPADRNIHVSARNLDGKALLRINDHNGLEIDGIDLRGADWTKWNDGAIRIEGTSNNITIKNCDIKYSRIGIRLSPNNASASYQISDCTFWGTDADGITVDGTFETLLIEDCNFERCGRDGTYNHYGYTYSFDNDAIGIGQGGVFAKLIEITGCDIKDTGPAPAVEGYPGGSAIFFGTDRPSRVDYVKIENNTIWGAHGAGIYLKRNMVLDGEVRLNKIEHTVEENYINGGEYSKIAAFPGNCSFSENLVKDNFCLKMGVHISGTAHANNNYIGNNRAAMSSAADWKGEVYINNDVTEGYFNYNKLWNSYGDSVLFDRKLSRGFLFDERTEYYDVSENSGNGTWSSDEQEIPANW